MKKSIIFIILGLFIFSIFLNVINISPVGADSGFDSSYDSGGGSWGGSSSGSSWGGSSWDSDFNSTDSGDWDQTDFLFTGIILLAIFVFLFLSRLLDKFVTKIVNSSIGKKISELLFNSNILVKIFIILIIILFILYITDFETLEDVIILLLILVATVIVKKITSKKNISTEELSNVLSQNDIINLSGKEFNIETFKNQAFNIYKDLQIAWMNFDYDKIKELVSDEIYNMYTDQLETLKIKDQQNIMSDIELIKCEIIDYSKLNNKEVFKVYMSVRCYDYIINTKNNKVLRGNKYKKLILNYILTFDRNVDIVEHCPQCGADVKELTECSYCKSKIVNNNDKLKMTKKQIVSQK